MSIYTGIHLTQPHGTKRVSHLPDSDDGVGDEDKENDKRLDVGGGRLLSLLKHGQHLDKHTGRNTLADI